VVSTLTQELRNLFVRMGVAPLALGVADPAVLGDDVAQWGSYYDHRPLVLAGRLESALQMLARRKAAHEAGLHDGRRDWSAAQLGEAVAAAGRTLETAGARVLATVLDNGAAFVALDEAAQQRGIVHVPLPQFFSAVQMQHALQAAGVDTLLVSAPLAAAWRGFSWWAMEVADEPLMHARLPAAEVAMPAHTAKISFTSGTTGAPKGVCLNADAMQRVAQGLVEQGAAAGERHLNALPFPCCWKTSPA
jgi:long-subunit acyl-CoA synthetase (AMP-forming)